MYIFVSAVSIFVGFFFFKQKTAYEMRISDWSSDVCSSDLPLCVRTSGSEVGVPNERWSAPGAGGLYGGRGGRAPNVEATVLTACSTSRSPAMTIWMGPLEIMRRTSSRSGSSFQSFETSGGAFARRWAPPAIIGTASSEKTPLGSEWASDQSIGAEARAVWNSWARRAGSVSSDAIYGIWRWRSSGRVPIGRGHVRTAVTKGQRC